LTRRTTSKFNIKLSPPTPLSKALQLELLALLRREGDLPLPIVKRRLGVAATPSVFESILKKSIKNNLIRMDDNVISLNKKAK